MDQTDDFPHRVRDLEHVTLPMRDGTMLSARIWLPESADRTAVPALLEYIPYRKRDGTRLRDEPMHRWFAGHGYAAVRVDLRGSGESEGVLTDEYAPQEQQDALDVLAWIADQPWCNGSVGMLGKSWGGFSALQVAALRPPQLRAVIAVCATDDRYADDAHYMGGCLLNENLIWGTVLMTLCAQPPDPALLGPIWRTRWRQRLAQVAAFPARWLRHPFRDDYWRHGSIAEDFAAVQVPVWAISGWADGYSNAVLRLLAGLRCPRHGLIGPWAHVYPHEGVPGPAIGFLQQAVQFWDRWLKGDDNGWQDEVRLRAWLQDSQRPDADPTHRPGRWVGETEWPSPRLQPLRLLLAPGRLLPEGAAAAAAPPIAHCSPQSVGLQAGAWCGFGLEGDQPGDQREDDRRSLCFDSAPLAEPLPILGAAELDLLLTVDRPVALLAARLCEVFADGASARVTYGLLNLTHRDGHATPRPLPVGEPLRVRIALNDAGHVFAAGSRLRLALSTSYWPLAWPAAAAVTVAVHPAGSALLLPQRPPRPEDDALPPLPPPRSAPPSPHTDVHAGGVRRSVTRDPGTGEVVHRTVIDLEPDGSPSLLRLDDIGLLTGHGIAETFTVRDDDPLSARAEVRHETITRRDGWSAAVSLRASLHADAEQFHFTAELVARENGIDVHRQRWHEVVPRRLV